NDQYTSAQNTISVVATDIPTPVNISTNSITNVSCFGSLEGAIDINVSGGAPPYRYEWSNGETTQDISGVGAGDYSIIVTDANDCEFTSEVFIVSQPLTALSIIEDTINDVL